MTIPIFDLKRQYRSIADPVAEKLKVLFESQSFILGDELKKLEENIASFCGTKYAVGVNSGTDALILTMDAMGIGAGDEVITSSFTFVATAEAIARVGAKPVFADVDERTYNIDPFLIEEKITKKTKAILPVHLYGLPADMDPILKTAKKHGLKVIEDCAQAIGSEYKSKEVGNIGDVGAFSFFPSKNLGAFGDGGMIVTSDTEIFEKIKLLRVHGSDRKYYHKVIGYNSRLDNIQAAVLNIKLPFLKGWMKARTKNADFFNQVFEDCPVTLPYIPEGMKHSFHLYVLRSPQAKKIVPYLNKNNIESRTYYPVPLHLQECFRFLRHKKGDFPVSERLCEESFAVPVYAELTKEEKNYIAEKIKAFF